MAQFIDQWYDDEGREIAALVDELGWPLHIVEQAVEAAAGLGLVGLIVEAGVVVIVPTALSIARLDVEIRAELDAREIA